MFRTEGSFILIHPEFSGLAARCKHNCPAHFLLSLITVQIIAIQQIIAEQIIAILILMKFQKAVYMPTLIRTENLSTDPGSKFRGASFLKN